MDAERIGEWLAGCFPGAGLGRVVELEGGWESNIYRMAVTHDTGAEDLVLRVYPGSGGATTAGREFAGMHHLHAAGYPVPRVIAAEPDAAVIGHPFLLMDWVPGAADRSWPEALHGSALTGFVRLLSHLHRVETASLDTETAIATRSVEETLRSWASIVAAHPRKGFEEALSWLTQRATSLTPMPRSVLHWDFHVGNVLVASGGTTHVVDWTQVEVGDRRFDVAWTALLIAMAVGDAAARSFCSEYEQQTGPLHEMEFFHAAAAFKRLFTVAISLAAGPESLGMRPEAAERMRSNLRHLEVPYRTVQSIAGLRIPAVDQLLEG